jgi:hypothetical protein
MNCPFQKKIAGKKGCKTSTGFLECKACGLRKIHKGVFLKAANDVANAEDAEILKKLSRAAGTAKQLHSYHRISFKVVGPGCAADLRLIYDVDPFALLGPQIEKALIHAVCTKQRDRLMHAMNENSPYEGVVKRNW